MYGNEKGHKTEKFLNKILFTDDEEVEDIFEAGIKAKENSTETKRSYPPLIQYTQPES